MRASGTSSKPGPAARPTLPSRDQRVRACQGLVRSLAWQIGRNLPPEVELEDLIGYGQVGLMQAVRDFDPQRQVQFATYAYHRIRGAILDGLAQMSWFRYEDYYNRRYVRPEPAEPPAAEAGPEPVDREAASPEPADGPQRRVYFSTRAGEQAEGLMPAAESDVAFRELRGKLRQLVDALPAETSALIRSHYFEGQTLTDAATQAGISKSWASRLQAQALTRLRRSVRQLELVE